jgi:Lrp/AsnC family transcriptional regulator
VKLSQVKVILWDMDKIDYKLLHILQHNADTSLDEISDKVSLSRNACWRRIKQLEQTGVIERRVALLNPAKLDLHLKVFIQIKTAHHNSEWTEKFSQTVAAFPEILGVYRTSGELDYLISAVVKDMAHYDRLYKRLTGELTLTDVSASFVMESIKDTTELPVSPPEH